MARWRAGEVGAIRMRHSRRGAEAAGNRAEWEPGDAVGAELRWHLCFGASAVGNRAGDETGARRSARASRVAGTQRIAGGALALWAGVCPRGAWAGAGFVPTVGSHHFRRWA